MTTVEEPSLFAPACVLAVDDYEPFRAVLRKVVDAAAGLRLVAEASSGEDAVAAVRELEPDMVVMDVVMPGIGGIDAAKLIKAERTATVVILVSTTHPDDLPADAEACADAVVWKPDLRPGVLESIWHRR